MQQQRFWILAYTTVIVFQIGTRPNNRSNNKSFPDHYVEEISD